jgi:2'-5' RNA ligase
MSAPDLLRLFVAVDPPDPIRTALAGLPHPLHGVSWTPPHQYHLTLRFIGEVPSSLRGRIEGALAPIRVEPFVLPLEGVGSFPPDRPPRVLWAGIGHGHPRLYQLRQKVDDALLGCGLDLDVKTFHPHFTLGRCGPGSRPGEITRHLRAFASWQGPPFRVAAFTLYRSELRPAGAVHTPLRRVELAQPPP